MPAADPRPREQRPARPPAADALASGPLPCVALVLLLAAALACAPTPTARRQAVLVVVDTLRRDALGCYAPAGKSRTPHIDALAAAGTRFDQAISTSGWTLPSVASLLTGTWPSVHKALGKHTRLTPISDDVPTAAELLSAAGVATGAVANAAFLSPMLGLQRGFEVFDHSPAFNRNLRRAVPSVDAGLEFVSRHADDDFFLVLHLFDPHLDYDPPPGFEVEGQERMGFADVQALCPQSEDGARVVRGAPSDADRARIRALYDAEVTYVDAAVGRLLAALEELGIRDQTLVVLTADHGEEFWEHGGFEHGHALYEELVRVPLIVDPPAGAGPSGGAMGSASLESAVDAQVRVLDVMPTVFELFGLPAPESFVGASLLPLMRGTTRSSRLAWSESTLYGGEQRALRDERYTYVVRPRPRLAAIEELYDWRTDPLETRNLASSNPDALARMRRSFARFSAELEERAASTRPGEARDVTPESAAAFEASIESLGYIGRDEE